MAGLIPAGRPEVSVVTPLLNESATVGELLLRLTTVLEASTSSYEIILVDDGSSSTEAAALRAAAAAHPATHLIRLPRNLGQVVALAIGMDRARGAVVVTMDGDLQDPPEEIPKLVAGVRAGADVVSACRDRRHGAMWRRVGSRTMNRVTGVLVGVALTDYGGQFNAYTAQMTRDLLAAWHLRTPILPLACSLASQITEVAVECSPRRAGRSRHGLGMKLGIVVDLLVGLPTARRVGTGILAAAAIAGTAAVARLPLRLRLLVLPLAAGGLGIVARRGYRLRYGGSIDDLRAVALRSAARVNLTA